MPYISNRWWQPYPPPTEMETELEHKAEKILSINGSIRWVVNIDVQNIHYSGVAITMHMRVGNQ